MNLEPLRFFLGQRIQVKETLTGRYKVMGCDKTFRYTREFAGILNAEQLVLELRDRGCYCDCEALQGGIHT